MNSTRTDHRLQTEKPTCSEKIEKMRLRRAVFFPVASQNAGSSGRQSWIHLPAGTSLISGGAAVVVIARPSVGPRQGSPRLRSRTSVGRRDVGGATPRLPRWNDGLSPRTRRL